jgi:tetratricopeptide (TPR) repeat protein
MLFLRSLLSKPDFSHWDAAPQNAETQATLARLQTLVENHFANADFAENKCCFDYSAPFGQTPERVSSEALLSAAEQRFKETILPFFARWNETFDVLNDSSLGDVASLFESDFIRDAAQTKFRYALALFQAGRYTESAKRFDALSKLKKKPDLTVYDDATWAAFQNAARLAADRARELAKTKKIKR